MSLHSAREGTRRALAHVPGSGAIAIALGVAAALGGTALYNRGQARRAERENTPVGCFLEVLRIIPGAGHMVDHAVPLEVAEAINRVASGRGRLQQVA
jgi:hypothetical protein